MTRKSVKPVMSKTSFPVEFTLRSFMVPCLFMRFWAESTTRSPPRRDSPAWRNRIPAQ